VNSLGRHILVEFSGCNPDILNQVSTIEKGMVDAAETAGATVINSTFHHFSPFGVSGVVVIQESHLAIHTWPEYGYAAVDLFTCGDTVDPWISFDHLKKVFKASNFSALEMYRGSLSLLNRTEIKMTLESGRKGVQAPKFTRTLWFTDKDEHQALSLRYTGDCLFNERNGLQAVRVFETPAYGKMLTIDGAIMCTERDEFHYHEMIVHPVAQLHGDVKKVLIIGGGDGGTAREVLRYPGVESVTLVEIDETVVKASKEFFPALSSAFGNPKLEVKIEDGISFVERAPSEYYDLIIVDGADPVGPAKGLFSEVFFKNCKRALKINGMLAAQGESPMFHEAAFVDLHQCLKNVFGTQSAHVALFHATSYPSGMWSIHVASKSLKHPIADFDRDAALRFSQSAGLKYYNEDLHAGAFALPTFVRQMLQGGKR
jgi:spermidine synthase